MEVAAHTTGVTMTTGESSSMSVEMRDMHKNPLTKKKIKVGKKKNGRKKKGRAAKPLAGQSTNVTGEDGGLWSEHVDKTTGKKYYSNQDTGRVTWTDHQSSMMDVELGERKKIDDNEGKKRNNLAKMARPTIQSSEKDVAF